jgi:ATP-dependent Lon protease
MDDLTIKKDVEAELEWEPRLNAATIGVAVKNGIVTLTGRVASYAEKMAAARAAARVTGVKAAANEIEVGLLPADERTAEIRGHRRTYIGALPARIIQGIRRVGARNPVFMLDEVDKLSVGFQGDPAATLLEVLDPAQNHAFVDQYLAVPFDLSSAMFICTANVTDTIPSALLDRLEVLELPGYTEEEKLQIARRNLVPPQLAETGLTAAQLTITDATLRRLIREYTREAGVRNLERWIGAIGRKIARQVSEGKTGPFSVDAAQLEDLLEPPRFRTEALLGEDEVGVCCRSAASKRRCWRHSALGCTR